VSSRPSSAHPLLLRQGCVPVDRGARQPQVPGEFAGHGPEQEPAYSLSGVLAVLGVPGVDVGLAAGPQGAVVSGEPGEELGAQLDLLAGEAPVGPCARLPAVTPPSQAPTRSKPICSRTRSARPTSAHGYRPSPGSTRGGRARRHSQRSWGRCTPQSRISDCSTSASRPSCEARSRPTTWAGPAARPCAAPWPTSCSTTSNTARAGPTASSSLTITRPG
jgi:hypothetical protein